MPEPSEMVVTIKSLVEAAQRIKDHLDGKRLHLFEVDHEGTVVRDYGEMSFKECKVDLSIGHITTCSLSIIPDRVTANSKARVLWPNASSIYAIVLNFLPDRLKLSDADKGTFEYRFISDVD